MRASLIKSLNKRKRTEIDIRSKMMVLQQISEDDLLDVAIPVLHGFLRKLHDGQELLQFTEVVCTIGRRVLLHMKQPRDSALAARIGSFIMYSFELCGMVVRIQAVGKFPGQKHVTHAFEILNRDALTTLFLSVDPTSRVTFPRSEPFPDWHSFYQDGHPLVHSFCEEVKTTLTPESHPMIFNAVNKMQRKGWVVNLNVLRHVEWALKNRAEVFLDIYEQKNQQAQRQKLYEVKEVLRLSESMKYWPAFYNRYYYDFRGRMYNASAFFSEQGGDLARGLLLRSVKKPISASGLFWLYVVIATTWGGQCDREDKRKSDKIPIVDRYNWAKENEAEFLKCAEDPRLNTKWMKAETPWQCLAACLELRAYYNWVALNLTKIKAGTVDRFDYLTAFQGFFDGTNNGSQHLCALTRDETTAHLVNLAKSEFPGDLYMYGAGHVWKELDTIVDNLTQEDMDKLDAFEDEYSAMKEDLDRYPTGSSRREELIAAMRELRAEAKQQIIHKDALFWQGFKDDKERRKIVKRGIMTIPYGATSYGMGDQVAIDSKKHGIESLYKLPKGQAAFMGNLLYRICLENMPRAMMLMRAFEGAGIRAEENEEMLSWVTPITKFPVIQHYVEGVTKTVDVKYGPKPEGEKSELNVRGSNVIQLNVCFFEETVLSKRKQSLGAAPNIVHSLDAAHLCLTVNRCDFDITTIHDSYGSLLPDMSDLFRIVRETFVELYKDNPLEILAKDLELDLSEVSIGTLDITQVLDSEYAFS